MERSRLLRWHLLCFGREYVCIACIRQQDPDSVSGYRNGHTRLRPMYPSVTTRDSVSLRLSHRDHAEVQSWSGCQQAMHSATQVYNAPGDAGLNCSSAASRGCSRYLFMSIRSLFVFIKRRRVVIVFLSNEKAYEHEISRRRNI